MRKVAVVIAGLAGLVGATHVWSLYDTDQAQSARLAEMVRIAAQGPRALPETPLKDASEPAKRVSGAQPNAFRVAAVTGQSDASGPLIDSVGILARPFTAPVRSEPVQRVAERDTTSSTPPPPRFTNARAGDAATRRDLAKSIQAELRRVGCYDGEIDGAWSTSSKRAMKAFVDRMNATLPVDEPDYILLTMLQGHTEQACGKGCPTGQVVAKDGQCQPKVIVAQTERKLANRPADVPANATTAGADPKAQSGARAGARVSSTGSATGSDEAREPASKPTQAQRQEERRLQDRAARLEAERAARSRSAEEQRLKAEAEAAEAQQAAQAEKRRRQDAERMAKAQAADLERQRRQVELEAKLSRDKARVEAEALVKQRDAEEKRLRVVAAIEEQRRLQLVQDLQRQQVRESQSAARNAAEEARARAQVRVEQKSGQSVTALPLAAPATTTSSPSGGGLPARAVEAAPVDRGAPPPPPVQASPIVTGATASAPQANDRETLPGAPQARGLEPGGLGDARRRQEPRFVQRFVPPPYYVGRIAPGPRPVVRPAPIYAQRAPGPSFRSRVFHDLGRAAP